MNHMEPYKIHPIVMGTKIFDKSMMTYQYGNGETYTIPIYSWYIEGGDKKILVDTGEMSPIQSKDRETAIGGKIYTFEEGLNLWNLKPEDIDETCFNDNLYDSSVPDPDLLIRTAGEMRVSNFLLWQISYAEFYVTDICWPDFKKADLEKAISTYANRIRRFGDVVS